MNDEEIIVRSLKYDGRVHREWRTALVRREGSLVVVEGAFESEVRHAHLGTLRRGTLSREFYWTDRWYSIFRFSDTPGELRYYYCNVNRPAEFDGRLLTFVDLDIDVLVAPDFTYRVLDEDEFELHAARYDYPPEVREQVPRALRELLGLIERRDFPFNEPDSG